MLMYITKADGSRELFDSEKLRDSLLKVGAEESTISEIIQHVTKELSSEAGHDSTTGAVYHHAFDLLRKRSLRVALKYSLRRALSELGPDGFPFEKFIAEIFKEQGYSTATDQMLQGNCVAHEVDVVAWKGDELIVVEAKFHNELGFKSDVKVALYVKARFDDLRGKETERLFDFGGKKRKITKSLLVTNTKFTDQALAYGSCSGVEMIGWNYPEKGNLEDLIEHAGLHPFTCLMSLSNTEKRQLLKKGVILCKDISRNPEILRSIGIHEAIITKVLEEITEVCGL